MLLRMFIHSAVFTVAIALGAVAMNGTNMFDGGGYSSDYATDNAFWQNDDDHKWKRREHDDD